MQTIYCSQCGKEMSIGPGHPGAVRCPHCSATVSLPVAGPSAIPPTSPAAWNALGYSHRSKIVAGLLGILLGGLGVHRFYLGYVGIGVIQIIVTFVTLGFGSIWGLIEGILCLVGQMRDAEGRPLHD